MTFVTAGLAVAGAVSILIPILIFLLWRQRRSPIEWGAMKFLIEAYRKHRRRLRLEQLLLLAVRCLILALLGLALARPLLESAGLLDSGGNRLVYLVIDDGLVSGAESVDGETSLESQVARALEIVGSLDPGDRVGLITASRPARVALSPPSTDLAGVRELLESLDPTQAPTDLPGALDRLGSALSSVDEELDQAFVYLLSDFRSGATTLEDTLPETLGQLGSRVVLRAAPPATVALANVQITAVEPARRLHIEGAIDGSGQVTVRLARQGGELGREVTSVRLNGDDIPAVQPQVIEWAPGQGTASVKFFLDLPVQRDREIGISASIDDDTLNADNVQHTVLALRKAIRVVLIDRRSFGYEPSLERLTAGQWLRRALAPAIEGPVEIIEVEPAALDAADLRAAEVAILPRPDLLTDEGWRALGDFVRQNGLLLVSPPAERTVHRWADRLSSDLGLPWQLERETVVLPESMPLSLEQPASTLLRMISSDLSELCRPVLVDRILPINQPQTQAASILVLNDGSPFMIAGSPRAEGAPDVAAQDGVDDDREARSLESAGGLVVYIASAPQLDWTNMPSKPLMVPLAHEIMRQGVSMIRGRSPVGVGTRPSLVLGRAAADLTGPGGERIALDSMKRPERRFDAAGLYTVADLAAQPIGTLAVNVDPNAGRTDLQPASAVKTWLARSGPWEWFDADDVANELARAESGSPLAGVLLVLVLALLVLETLLARWFSHAHQARSGDSAGGIRSTMYERPLHERPEPKRRFPLGPLSMGGGA